MRVAMAQVAPTVGDIDGNAQVILDAWRRAERAGADLVVFTELAVTGYPPEDLLLKPAFVQANHDAVDRLAREGPPGTVAVVGAVGDEGDDADSDEEWDVAVTARNLRNRAVVLADGEVRAVYDKLRLPNYGVFDEARYFIGDDEPTVVRVAGVPVGVTICEDLWADEGPVATTVAAGARLVVNLNASPYHRGRREDRERWVRGHAERHGVGVVYVNQVGGQDELVFDGDSMAAAPGGAIVARGRQFAADLVVVDLDLEGAGDDGLDRDDDGGTLAADLTGFTGERPEFERQEQPRLGEVAEVWEALVLGTRDYCHKNGFTDAVLGLSGGIDSSLTAAIAVAALGPEHVTGVAMSSPYTSDESVEDAKALAVNLGMRYEELRIDAAMDAFDDMLADLFADTEPDETEENIQARIRGMILMALSNKFGSIVLATGNKSEMAVGYATLYGDMAGGFAVIKDVPKLLVYELSRYCNRDGEVIPDNVIRKPPTAELRPDQKDSDSLPDYDLLDPIIEAYVEDDRSVDDIVAAGADRETVERVARLIDAAEFKRRQAPPGVKITERAFGKERRVPMTTAWRG